MTSAKEAYAAKLRDPRWQQKRLEIMQRDKFTCQAEGCGDTKTTLNINHIRYVRGGDPWDSPNEDLVTLCEPCHDAFGILGSGPIPIKEANLSHEGEDVIHDAISAYGIRPPAPSILKRCREIASEPCIIRLVNRLAWEGTLRRGASRPETFVAAVRLYSNAEKKARAA